MILALLQCSVSYEWLNRQMLRQPATLVRVACLWVSVTSVATVQAQTDQSAGEGSRSATATIGQRSLANVAADEEVAQQLLQLDSPEFVKRQQATRTLLQLSAEAASVIQSIRLQLSDDARLRLEMIEKRLHQRWFATLLQQLEADELQDPADHFPDWLRYRSLVSESPSDVTVFLELLKAEPELFACRLYAPQKLSGLLEIRARNFETLCHGRVSEEFPAATAAALMLIGSDERVRLVRGTSHDISRCFDDPRFSSLIRTGDFSQQLTALSEAWMLRSRIAPDRPLIFAIRHRLPAGRKLALRVLAERRRGPRVFYAAMAVAALGSREDLPVLESLLQDMTVIWPPAAAVRLDDSSGSYRVEVRDAILLAAAHLRSISPADLGMAVRRSAETLYRLDTAGFSLEENRQRALQEYRELTTEPQ